jgi:hypothetical protein
VSGRNGRGLKWLGCGAFYRPEEVGRREAVGVEWASFKTLVSVAGAREVVKQGAITGEEEAQGGGTRLLAWRRVARRGCVWSAAMVACCWLEEGDDLVMWASWAKHAKVV